MKKRKAKTTHSKHTKPAPSFECRLCGELIKITKWKKHLALKHGVFDVEYKFKEYYITQKQKINQKQIANYPRKGWYKPNAPKSPYEYHCGDVVNGPPKVKIIYNPIFSSRRRF